MNAQFRAIREVHNFFTREGIPYVLIGGIALQFWGEPRFTRDIDVTILVEMEEKEGVILRQGKKLNVRYIKKWLRKFSEILSMPEIFVRFEKIYKKYKG